ncbi:MAG: hypothetical protein ACOZQL_37055 [Myxococcota bacterium]
MRALVVATCVVLTTGCATGRIPRVPGDPPPAVKDVDAERRYQETLERFTSARGVYDNLDSKVFVQATWQSPTFAEARVRREGLFKAWPEAELEQRLAAERARLEDATELFFAVHANDYRFDDFDRPNTMWRMVLVAGGEELRPLSIERLGRTNVELRSYYSYLESFWVGYRVRFPKHAFAAGETFRLKLASALGQAELPFTAD